MSESATEDLTPEERWIDDLGTTDGDDPTDDIEGGDDPESEGEETDDEGSPPDEPESEPDPSEGADAEAHQEAGEGEGEDGDEGEDGAEAGEPEADEPEGAGGAAPPEAGDQDPAPEQPESVEYEPFTLKADGRQQVLSGSMNMGHGIYVPRDTWQKEVQPFLADRAKLVAERDRLQRQLESKAPIEQQAQAIVDHFEALLTGDPDKAWEWFQSFQTNAPVLLAESRTAAAEAKASAYERERETERVQEATRQFNERAPGVLRSAVDVTVRLPEFQDLGLDAQLVYDQLARLPIGQTFFTASEDIPEWGVKKGDTTVDWNLVAHHVQSVAEHAKRLREREQQQQIEASVREAKKANQSRGGKRKPVPPAVPAAGTPTPRGTEFMPKSQEEWASGLREV